MHTRSRGPANTPPRSNDNRETRNLHAFHYHHSNSPEYDSFDPHGPDSHGHQSHGHQSHGHNDMFYQDDNNNPDHHYDNSFEDHNDTHLTQKPDDHHWNSSDNFFNQEPYENYD